MKIPTILGLALLIALISFALIFYSYNLKIMEKEKVLYAPKNIKTVNVSDTQATIAWLTDTPSQGKVIYNTNNILSNTQPDDRDQTPPKVRLSHFVTLRNLSPSTKYYFKIISGKFSLPENILTFQTPPKSQENNSEFLNNYTSIPPLRGVILNTNLTPVDDALIFLNINGLSELATYSTGTGNFILPLVNLRTADLKSLYKITGKTDTTLTIQKGLLESKIQLKLPTQNPILPPLTLGQNLNLDNYLEILQKRQDYKNSPSQFDLNNDGRINSLDLSILTQAVNKKVKDPKYDFNKDNSIDNKDLEVLRKALQ